MQIFRKLPLLNILRKPVRSAILLCLTAVLSFTVFGGALMVSSLRSGMTSLKERLGADIMVIPEEAAEKESGGDCSAGTDRILLYGGYRNQSRG